MTTPPQASTPADPEASRVASIDEKIETAMNKVLDEVRKIVGGARTREGEHLTDPGQSRTARAEQAGVNLDQMIADAVKVNDDARAKAEAEKAHKERHDQIDAAAAEKTPIQRGVLHRFMRWGEPPQ